MVDGVSIAVEVVELAGILWHIYKRLKEFVHDVHIVDSVARELLDKVDSLKEVVNSVKWVTELLRDPTRSRRLSTEEQRTLQALSKSIAPCNRILGRFHKALDGLIDDRNNPSWLGKTRRQLKLENRQHEIKTLENFIEGRIRVLHAMLACLQMFQIDGNHRQIINHLDDLRDDIERSGMFNAHARVTPPSPRLESGLNGVVALIYEEQARIETHAVHLITDARLHDSMSGSLQTPLAIAGRPPTPLLTYNQTNPVQFAPPNDLLQPAEGPPRIPTPDFGETQYSIESMFRGRPPIDTRPLAAPPSENSSLSSVAQFKADLVDSPVSEAQPDMLQEPTLARRDTIAMDTALVEASREGDLEAVQMALRAGANPDFEADTSERPLYIAAYGGHQEIVRRLLEAKANPDLPSLGGWTALHCAVRKRQIDVLKTLLSHSQKANINAKCDQGTSLHLTAETGDRELAGLLIVSGADVTLRDCNERTALEMAVQTNQVDFVKWWFKVSPQCVVRAEKISGARSYMKSLVKNNMAPRDTDSLSDLSPVSSVESKSTNRRRSSANSTSTLPSLRSGMFGRRRRESKTND